MRSKKVGVLLLCFPILAMGAGPTEEQLARFRQFDAKSVVELKNTGLAQYLEARTVIH